jgi:hypothetical protein
VKVRYFPAVLFNIISGTFRRQNIISTCQTTEYRRKYQVINYIVSIDYSGYIAFFAV